jgi:hypothetical protein
MKQFCKILGYHYALRERLTVPDKRIPCQWRIPQYEMHPFEVTSSDSAYSSERFILKESYIKMMKSSLENEED